jgi:hypothetical protein
MKYREEHSHILPFMAVLVLAWVLVATVSLAAAPWESLKYDRVGIYSGCTGADFKAQNGNISGVEP